MNIKRPLAPGFLNRLDNWLLIHKPDIWSTRVHMVLYYCLLAAIGIGVISYISPLDYEDFSSSIFWSWLTGVVSLIGLITWLIYLLRFNVFKRYGKLGSFYSIKTFISYFVATGCFVLLPFLPSYMETFRTKMKYSKVELIEDINAINTSVAKLTYSFTNHNWRADTFLVRKNISDSAVAVATDTVTYPAEEVITDDSYYPRKGYAVVDEYYIQNLKENRDSIVQVNDSMYIVYAPPAYQYINSYHLNRHSGSGILSNADIYEKVIRHYKQVSPAETRELLHTLTKKYYYDFGYKPYPGDSRDGADHLTDIRAEYHLSSVEYSINNIAEKLTRYDSGNLPILFRIFLYTTLGITLLVYIFRHSEKRTFFLSLLVAVLLFILTCLFLAFNNADEVFVTGLLIFYILAFFLISLSVWGSKIRSTISGIGLNLFSYTIFGLPLLTVLFSSLAAKERYNTAQNNYSDNYEYLPEYKYPDYELAFRVAEWAGFILLFILIATYIHKTYRRWYSLPEN